ncbi:hypothetical protein SAMN04487915_104139 [Arthrobacter sp. ov118]|nr:hypothetical protein SAMN04487915_104139 [Arthrobacter sp. ov118]
MINYAEDKVRSRPPRGHSIAGPRAIGSRWSSTPASARFLRRFRGHPNPSGRGTPARTKVPDYRGHPQNESFLLVVLSIRQPEASLVSQYSIALRAPETPHHAACRYARILVPSSRWRENRSDRLPAPSMKSSELRTRALCPAPFGVSERPSLGPAAAKVSLPTPRPTSDRGNRTQDRARLRGNFDRKTGRGFAQEADELGLHFLCLVPFSTEVIHMVIHRL